VEAPSFHLPVVNIGTRQRGRIRGRNVIDVGYERSGIFEGVRRAVSQEFNDMLKGEKNPYGSGNASEKILDTLKRVSLDARLIVKRFLDVSSTSISRTGGIG
jgi:UDP-N-acetylglucosamine 2-epimerase (non-hydrolysing)/GDP/UDP-N,N'-diacetylbacillosamine 2-epimerase (hydrolysing)